MTMFRPCIDLHDGRVKQIVGGSLRDGGVGPIENFVSEDPPGAFARRFREDQLRGGHIILLGSGNEEAAREALAAWPGGLQVGGGINDRNIGQWLEAGASHAIVTSWLFDPDGKFRESRLEKLSEQVTPGRLVVDLSCRRTTDGWQVAMNRWQTLTDLAVTPETLERLAPYCDEFLIHAADVEGKCEGVDADLVRHLSQWTGRPITYAGGVATIDDLRLIEEASSGAMDVTVGSALDIFGGKGVTYERLLEWNAGVR